jgi:cation diffusion facilitator family transporter
MAYRKLRGPLILSLVAAVSTIGVKSLAFALTGSAGLLADALESCVNLLAAIAAYFSISYSERPADPDHAFGHEKIEFFSSGLEGGLVLLAGLGSVLFAIDHLLRPSAPQQIGIGVALALVASAINLVVALQLLRVGKQYHSIVLEADGHHLLSDVITTAAVVAGLGLVALTDISQIDAILAMLVGFHIVWTGFKLIRRSFDGLMDRALASGEIAALRETIRQSLPRGADFHHLRTRRAGRRQFADFHLLVDGSMTVREAHVLGHELEDKLRAAFPVIEVTIHLEPIDDSSSWEPHALTQLGEEATPGPRSGLAAVPPPIDD